MYISGYFFQKEQRARLKDSTAKKRISTENSGGAGYGGMTPSLHPPPPAQEGLYLHMYVLG